AWASRGWSCARSRSRSPREARPSEAPRGGARRSAQSLRLCSPAQPLLLIQRDRFLDEALQRSLVDLLVLSDVDRAPDLALEARVEEPLRILQRRALEEGQLDDALVRLAGADAAVVRPDRSAGARRLRPLPLFDDLGVRFLDDPAHVRERLAAPV